MRRRRHDPDVWVTWVIFSVGLLLVCIAIAELLLAVADGR